MLLHRARARARGGTSSGGGGGLGGSPMIAARARRLARFGWPQTRQLMGELIRSDAAAAAAEPGKVARNDWT